MIWVEYDLCFNAVKVRGVNEEIVAVLEKQMHIIKKKNNKKKHINERLCL